MINFMQNKRKRISNGLPDDLPLAVRNFVMDLEEKRRKDKCISKRNFAVDFIKKSIEKNKDNAADSLSLNWQEHLVHYAKYARYAYIACLAGVGIITITMILMELQYA